MRMETSLPVIMKKDFINCRKRRSSLSKNTFYSLTGTRSSGNVGPTVELFNDKTESSFYFQFYSVILPVALRPCLRIFSARLRRMKRGTNLEYNQRSSILMDNKLVSSNLIFQLQGTPLSVATSSLSLTSDR